MPSPPFNDEQDSFLQSSPINTHNHRDERHILLDRALEEIGFGKFHMILLAVVSFGTFVDSSETALISIIFPMLQLAWGTTYEDLALIGSLTSVGMMLGSMIWGALSDHFGRKAVYVITLIGVSLLGFTSSFATSSINFAVSRLFVGFAYGGNTITGVTLMLEFMPFAFRARATSYNSLSWGIGAFIITAIGWLAGNAVGWAWLVRLPSILSIPILFGSMWVSESPRWMIRHEMHVEAVKAMETIAMTNMRPMPPFFTVDALDAALKTYKEFQHETRRQRAVEERLAQLSVNGGSSSSLDTASSTSSNSAFRIFRSWSFLKLLIPLACVWFFASMAATLFSWIPLAVLNLPGMPGGTNAIYSIGFTMACGNLMGCVVMFGLGTWFQRPTLLSWSLMMCATLCLCLGLSSAVPEAVYVFAFFVIAVFQISINNLYLYTPEVTPTSARTTVFGICMFWHRLGFVVAPFILSELYTPHHDFMLICGVFATFFIAAWLFGCFLFVTTLNEPLKEDEDFFGEAVKASGGSSGGGGGEESVEDNKKV